MEIWTVIGLLAAFAFASFFYVGTRIDALGARMASGFDAVAARFDEVNSRLDALSARMDAHVDRHAG